MAVVITNSEFSFVNFKPTVIYNCEVDPSICLPVFRLTDLQFQIIATVTGADKNTFNQAGNKYAGTVTQTIYGDVDKHFEYNFKITWNIISSDSSPDHANVYAGNCVFNAGNTYRFNNLIPIGSCFNISIVKWDGTNTIIKDAFIKNSWNCFARIKDDNCFTSVIKYSSNSNSFGFYYGGYYSNWYNQVRVPLMLHSPTNSEKETNYERSDGSTKILSYRLWKDYDFKTDYLDDKLNESVQVMLSHDSIIITNGYANLINQSFVRREKIERNWVQKDTPSFKLAQSTGTLRMASPRAMVTSNCI